MADTDLLGGLDLGGDDSGALGSLALSGGSFGSLTPEEQALPKYLEDAFGQGKRLFDTSTGALSAYEQQAAASLAAKKTAIQAGLDKLLAQKPDRTGLLLALASGFLAPTKTGSFGESLGQAGAAAVPQIGLEKQRSDARDLAALRYQLESAGVDTDEAKLRLGAATQRGALGSKLMSDALKLQNSRLLLLGRQAGSRDLAELRGKLAKTPLQREAEQLYPNDPAQQADYIKSTRQASLKTPVEREAESLYPDDAEAQRRYVAQARGIVGGIGSGAGTPAPEQLTGENFLKTLPPGLANQIKGIAEGRQLPSGFGKQKQQLLELANRYDPTFDAAQLPVRTAIMKDLTSGQTSRNIAAFNTAIRHMRELDEAFERLHNSSVPLVSRPYNWVANQLGGEGPIADFNSAKTAVATELAKAYRGAGALNQSEVEDWLSSLSPNASPEQQRDVMGRLARLLEGRVETIQEQAEKNLGPTVSKNIFILNPKNRPILDYFKDRAAGKKVKRPGAGLTEAEQREKQQLEEELGLPGATP